MRTFPLCLLGALLLVADPRPACAVVQAQSDYPFEQVWNAAVRLVRVDLGFEVTERDAEGGFVLFRYRGESGTFNASLEVVRLQGNRVNVICRIPEMPRYTEIFLVDRLTRKLRDEYGAPPPRPAQTPAAGQEPRGALSASKRPRVPSTQR